jgi:antitoxin ParD1/3/4
VLAIFCHRIQNDDMSTMNISLPDELKVFVDRRIRSEGYGSSSEYMRELIRRDRDRAQFRQHLLEGVKGKPVGDMDTAYFASLRKKLKGAGKKKA